MLREYCFTFRLQSNWIVGNWKELAGCWYPINEELRRLTHSLQSIDSIVLKVYVILKKWKFIESNDYHGTFQYIFITLQPFENILTKMTFYLGANKWLHQKYRWNLLNVTTFASYGRKVPLSNYRKVWFFILFNVYPPFIRWCSE